MNQVNLTNWLNEWFNDSLKNTVQSEGVTEKPHNFLQYYIIYEHSWNADWPNCFVEKQNNGLKEYFTSMSFCVQLNKISPFVFSRRNKFIQVWNNLTDFSFFSVPVLYGFVALLPTKRWRISLMLNWLCRSKIYVCLLFS